MQKIKGFARLRLMRLPACAKMPSSRVCSLFWERDIREVQIGADIALQHQQAT